MARPLHQPAARRLLQPGRRIFCHTASFATPYHLVHRIGCLIVSFASSCPLPHRIVCHGVPARLRLCISPIPSCAPDHATGWKGRSNPCPYAVPPAYRHRPAPRKPWRTDTGGALRSSAVPGSGRYSRAGAGTDRTGSSCSTTRSPCRAAALRIRGAAMRHRAHLRGCAQTCCTALPCAADKAGTANTRRMAGSRQSG